MEWKWSNGTINEKSYVVVQKHTDQHDQNNIDFMKIIEENTAYNQSLEVNLDTWHTSQYIHQPNQREDSYVKMSQREHVSQIGRNPFLDPNANYIEDIGKANKYLQPINTVKEKDNKINIH